MKFSFWIGLSINLALLLLTNLALAQKENANWCFGEGIKMAFKDSGKVLLGDSKVKLYTYPASSISDKNGKMLLYFTEGGELYDTYNRLIDRYIITSRHIGYTSPILNIGNQFSDFILFTFNNTDDYLTLLKNQIHFDSVGGSFKVISRNIPVSNRKMGWKMHALKHANGKDWWLITIDKEKRSAVVFEVIGTEIFERYESKANPYNLHDLEDYGELTSNPEGTYLCNMSNPGLVELFRFDRCSGEIELVENLIEDRPDPLLPHRANYISTAFSKNYFLYVLRTRELLQYDLRISPVKLSRTLIHYIDSFINIEESNYLQGIGIGLDGKMYIGQDYVGKGNQERKKNEFNTHLAIIHNPERKGKDCKFQINAFSLENRLGFVGPPSMPNHAPPLSLKTIATASGQGDTVYTCPTEALRLGTFARPNIRYKWSPANQLDSDTLATPTFTGEKAGTYSYILRVTGLQGSCWENETASDTLWIIVREKKDTLCKHVSRTTPLAQQFNCSVYPNPSQDGYTLSLKSDQARDLTVEVHNFTGVKVLERKISLINQEVVEQYLDARDWVAGMYLCTIRENGIILNSQKLILSR